MYRYKNTQIENTWSYDLKSAIKVLFEGGVQDPFTQKQSIRHRQIYLTWLLCSNFAYINRWNQINPIIYPLLILLPHLLILINFLPPSLIEYFTPPPTPPPQFGWSWKIYYCVSTNRRQRQFGGKTTAALSPDHRVSTDTSIVDHTASNEYPPQNLVY